MNKSDLQSVFANAGLSRLEKDIDSIACESIRINTTPIEESTLPVGVSKLGGAPDLPSGTVWPEWKNEPQSFIAQIRLDDIRPLNIETPLPSQGMLWFFYDAKQETYGDDPHDRGGWQVLFHESTDNLQRTPAPASLSSTSQFSACSVRFSQEITLAQQPQLDIPNFDWTQDEQQKYEQLLASFPGSEAHATPPHHRLLGFPDTIQDDMRQQCELVSHGITDDSDPQATELEKHANEWQLLLQIDTDERIGMRWASSGMLYYWITQADMQSHTFDATWLVLQSE